MNAPHASRPFGAMSGAIGRVLALSLALTISCTPPGKPRAREVPADQITDFRVLYADNCSGCHGADGKYGPGRILNDRVYLAFIPKEELKKTVVNGRPGTAMPAWARSQGGPLTDKQIDILVEGIYSNWARPFNPHDAPVPAYTAASSGDPARGKRLFARACFMCHGPGAKVGPVTIPAYLELVSNQMLRTSIVVGRPDLGMPDYRYLNAGKPLSDPEVTDLVAYLVSLRPAPGPAEGLYTKDSGNLGSGNGPGSPTSEQPEGHKHENSSVQGGTVETSARDKK